MFISHFLWMNLKSGCGTKCSLDQFYQLFDHIIPKQDFESECKLWPPKSVKESDTMTWKGKSKKCHSSNEFSEKNFHFSELIGPIICTFIVFFSTIYGWHSDRYDETT